MYEVETGRRRQLDERAGGKESAPDGGAALVARPAPAEEQRLRALRSDEQVEGLDGVEASLLVTGRVATVWRRRTVAARQQVGVPQAAVVVVVTGAERADAGAF